MSTAVIILQYNNSSDTINCIRSVELTNSADISYVIVDNHSKDGDCVLAIENFLMSEKENDYQIIKTIEECITPLPRFTFFKNHENRGYAAGNNIGLQISFSDSKVSSILILNNDILFVEDIIPQMNTFLINNDRCAIVSPVLYKHDYNTVDMSCARRDIKPSALIVSNIFAFNKMVFQKSISSQYMLKKAENIEQPFEIELPSGSCMLISKSFIQDINGFDESTFLYYEENILYRKTKELGMANYLLPNTKCIHLGGKTTRSSDPLRLIKISRDSCMYYLKRYCSYSKTVLLLVGISWSIRIGLLAVYKKVTSLFSHTGYVN